MGRKYLQARIEKKILLIYIILLPLRQAWSHRLIFSPSIQASQNFTSSGKEALGGVTISCESEVMAHVNHCFAVSFYFLRFFFLDYISIVILHAKTS